MDPEELKTMITGAVQEVVKPVADKVDALEAKLANEPAVNGAGFETGDAGAGQPSVKSHPAFDAFYVARFGDEDAKKQAVLGDVVGKNYRQVLWEQEMAFAKYLRFGEKRLAANEHKLLQMQIFPYESIMKMVGFGHTIAGIKDTMVEAQGTLGGYAVPPQRQAEYAARLPGLTAVRGNGATVINLTTGNGTTVIKYTGGDDRYPGNIRGQWTGETGAGADQNATLGEDRLDAHFYSYPIWMSRALVSDASNLVELVMDDVINVGAIDEDQAFLIGDGAGKPYGITPGGLNALGLTEVNSGAASALTTAGIKALKRGIAAQYRGNSSAFVGNSDTYSDIENLTVSGTGSDFAFPSLSEDGVLLRRPAAESEAMPDVAANAYPLLYGNMMGYYILEREGMAIERFHDSGTGATRVKFEVYRRVGGRLVKTWMMAVQKVAS